MDEPSNQPPETADTPADRKALCGGGPEQPARPTIAEIRAFADRAIREGTRIVVDFVDGRGIELVVSGHASSVGPERMNVDRGSATWSVIPFEKVTRIALVRSTRRGRQ